MAVNDVVIMVPVFQNGVAGTLARNTLKYQITVAGSSDVAEGNALAQALHGLWFPSTLHGYFPAGTILRAVLWYGVSKPELEGQYVADTPGTATTDLLPHSVNPLITKNTGRRGREYTGRMFYATPVEETQAAGVLAAAFVTALGNALTAAINVSGAGSEAMKMVLARLDYSQDPPTINNLADVTSLTVRTRLSGIRRRRPGAAAGVFLKASMDGVMFTPKELATKAHRVR